MTCFEQQFADVYPNVQAALSAKRFAHVERVCDYATALAERYGAPVAQVRLAALVHDYAKERPTVDFEQAVVQHSLPVTLLDTPVALWHGLIGADLIATELGVTDPVILDAVRQHTTAAPEMSQVAQILFMADYLETGRDFSGVAAVREATNQSLTAGIRYQLSHTIAYLAQKEQPIDARSLRAYNFWITQPLPN